MTRTAGIIHPVLIALAACSVLVASGSGAGTASAETRQPGPSGARAGDTHHRFGAGEGPFEQSLNEALDLSEEQADGLRRIRMDYGTMTIDRTAAIRVGEVELAALLDDEQPDLDAIRAKVRAIGALETELMMGRVAALLQVKKILTKGQYEAFQDELMRRMKSLVEGPLPPEHSSF